MDLNATVRQESSKALSSDAAKTMREMGAVSESVKTAETAGPAESEIAKVAYRLWLDNGRPVGSDQEDWFRAEAILKDRTVAVCEALSRRPSILRCDVGAESEVLAEFTSEGWQGHWEVWEREWVGARWSRPLHAFKFGIEQTDDRS
jgi:hypothetical protein